MSAAPALKRTAIFLFLVVLSLIALSPLLSGDWYLSHDAEWHIQRLFAVSEEMRHGNFYPRWLSGASYGKGLPIFNYYSPLFFLLTSLLHVAGLPLLWALKLVCFLLIFLGASGMFAWVREHSDDYGALLAATVYTFLPYHFLDLYVRGALPEFAALAALPWLFLGIDLSFSADRSRRGLVVSAIAWAATLLSHNISTVLILPFALLYFCWHLFGRKRQRPLFPAAALWGPVCGAGLSAYYWLPMVAELKYLRNFKATIGAESYADHFVYPIQWVSSFWGFGTSSPGPVDGMSFQLGYALLAFVVVGCVALFTVDRGRRWFGIATLLLGCLGLFLTIPPSAPLYQLVQAFKYAQFPWRFLGPSTLFLAAFTGIGTGLRFGGRQRLIPPVLLLAAFVLCVGLSHDHRKVHARAGGNLDQLEQRIIADNELGVMALQNEYLPRWVEDTASVDLKPDLARVLGSFSPRGGAVKVKGSELAFAVDARNTGGDVTVPVYFFPGWRGEVDGASAELEANPMGFITFPVPPGEHRVRLWLGTTWPRAGGWGLALLTALGMALALKFRKV
jgi:hypothetical protein